MILDHLRRWKHSGGSRRQRPKSCRDTTRALRMDLRMAETVRLANSGREKKNCCRLSD